MQPPNYQELRKRYAGLSTEELLELAINSSLTDGAKTALEAELNERAKTEDLRNYVIVEQKQPEKDRLSSLFMWLFTSFFVPLTFYLVLPWWKKFLTWLAI